MKSRFTIRKVEEQEEGSVFQRYQIVHLVTGLCVGVFTSAKAAEEHAERLENLLSRSEQAG